MIFHLRHKLGIKTGIAPKLAIMAMFAGLFATAAAGEFTLSGSVSGELRYFTQKPAFPSQQSRRLYPSLSFEPRLAYDWNEGNDSIIVTPFLRLDNNNIGRSHADLREAYWLHRGDGWSLTTGINKVYWGVAETNQLVDIINQDDALEEIYGDEKLGQPMINLSLFRNFGTIDLFVMPLFREFEFLSNRARLSLPVPINDVEFSSSRGRNNIDYALRWSQSFGNWDLALSHFKGTSREPRLVRNPTSITPFYDEIDQSGLELQYTSGNWLWKLETISRTGQGPQFWAAVGGFEWTMTGVLGSGADLGLLMEYNYDKRDPLLAPISIYDDDLFLGARLALNDIDNSSLLVGALLDQNTDATALTLEASRRLGEDWVLGLEAGFFANATPPDPIAFVNNDDYLSFTMKRSF
jgi:hypothetical protein